MALPRLRLAASLFQALMLHVLSTARWTTLVFTYARRWSPVKLLALQPVTVPTSLPTVTPNNQVNCTSPGRILRNAFPPIAYIETVPPAGYSFVAAVISPTFSAVSCTERRLTQQLS